MEPTTDADCTVEGVVVRVRELEPEESIVCPVNAIVAGGASRSVVAVVSANGRVLDQEPVVLSRVSAEVLAETLERTIEEALADVLAGALAGDPLGGAGTGSQDGSANPVGSAVASLLALIVLLGVILFRRMRSIGPTP